jgi:hypothetical protein
MGDIYIELTLINDANPEQQCDVVFLVDTGTMKAK